MLLTSDISIGVISALIALFGIIVSFFIAIFGDDLKAFWRKPKLSLRLPDIGGEWTVLRNSNQKVGGNPAIYFHALLENKTPPRVAKSVELFVFECTVTPEGRTPCIMPLPCPLPVKARRDHSAIDIGSTPHAYDLLRCVNDAKLELLLNCNTPNNFKPRLEGPGTLDIAIQATGLNTSSNKMWIKIKWDGVFPKESNGIEPHIKITIKSN